jgi:hypothetical protein
MRGANPTNLETTYTNNTGATSQEIKCALSAKESKHFKELKH